MFSGSILLLISYLTAVASVLTAYLKSIDKDSTARKAVQSVLIAVCTAAQIGFVALRFAARGPSIASFVTLAVFLLYAGVASLFSFRFFANKEIRGLSSKADSAYSRFYIYLFAVLVCVFNTFQLFSPSRSLFASSGKTSLFVAGLVTFLSVTAGILYLFFTKLTPQQIAQRLGSGTPSKMTPSITTPAPGGMQVQTTPAPIGVMTLQVTTSPLNNTTTEPTPMEPTPEIFDCRVKWKNCITPIRHQHNCGCCVAFATTSVLSDRLAIASGGTPLLLSPQYIMQCQEKYITQSPQGCVGGNGSDQVMDFLCKSGTVLNSCFPYKYGNSYEPELMRYLLLSGTAGFTASFIGTISLLIATSVMRDGRMQSILSVVMYVTLAVMIISAVTVAGIAVKPISLEASKEECAACCPTTCVGGKQMSTFKFSRVYAVPADVESIKQEIFARGPVVANIMVTSDFPSMPVRSSYVFTPKPTAEPISFHCISIIGWNKKGWLVRNQWGNLWGNWRDPGCITIAYGALQIENFVMTGVVAP